MSKQIKSAECILKRADIENMAGTPKAHFLNPEAQRTNWSLGDATGLTGLGFHIIEVPPGHPSTEYHAHYFEDECTYVLSGSGRVRIGDEEFDIEAGDFVAYPKGGPAHTMTNTGSVGLRCIVVGERLAHDVADYPDKAKRIFRNATMAWDLVDHDAIENPDAGAK